MDTRPTAAEGHFELGEKYLRWKETYLPAGDTTSMYSLIQHFRTLDDERLKAAHEAAVAGFVAEKLLAHIKPIGNFHYVVGLTTVMMARRGLINEANDRGLNHEDTS